MNFLLFALLLALAFCPCMRVERTVRTDDDVVKHLDAHKLSCILHTFDELAVRFARHSLNRWVISQQLSEMDKIPKQLKISATFSIPVMSHLL